MANAGRGRSMGASSDAAGHQTGPSPPVEHAAVEASALASSKSRRLAEPMVGSFLPRRPAARRAPCRRGSKNYELDHTGPCRLTSIRQCPDTSSSAEARLYTERHDPFARTSADTG